MSSIETTQSTTESTEAESARGRVKRIVISPLVEAGMRFRRGTDAEKAQAQLNRICDEISYASDTTLAAIRVWAEANGEGSERCFWPTPISFISVAHAFEPRPLEELPVLASWFGSSAGPEAREAGRLVAEYQFLVKRRRPPLNDVERRAIVTRAADLARRFELTSDRIARGVRIDDDDQAFMAWHRKISAHAEALVDAGQRKRRTGGAA